MAFLHLKAFESNETHKIKARPAGNYRVSAYLRANALYNSLVVRSIAGTVTINIYEQFNEVLNPIDTQVYSTVGVHQWDVGLYHNNLMIEVITTGLSDLGIHTTPRTVLDAAELTVVSPITEPDPADYVELIGQTATTPGVVQTLTSYVVPAARRLYLSMVYVSTLHPGVASLFKDAAEVRSGRLSAANVNWDHALSLRRPFSASETLKLDYDSCSGRITGPIDFYVTGRLVDV